MFSPVIPEEGEGERGLASSSTTHNTNLLTTVKKYCNNYVKNIVTIIVKKWSKHSGKNLFRSEFFVV
jgi:hypothetical protein